MRNRHGLARRLTVATGILLAICVGVGAIAALSSANDQAETSQLFTVKSVSNEIFENPESKSPGLSCSSVFQPTEFARFSLGEEVDGLRVEAVRRRCVSRTEGPSIPENFVSYIYGDCDARSGEGVCAPPVEIQTWPACHRSFADYQEMPGVSMEHDSLQSMGRARIAKFDGGLRAEIYTADSTVVIFGMNQRQVDAALSSVQRESEDSPATQISSGAPKQILDAPEAGSMKGELSCGR